MMIYFLEINNIGNTLLFEGDLLSKGIADGIILTLINHQNMTKKEAATVFRVGSGRWTKIRRSTSEKKPSYLPYGLNGTQITKKDLKILDHFLESLDVELGYPCNHRRMKRLV
jgi:hypothetical protein